jgi:hypothetical protein
MAKLKRNWAMVRAHSLVHGLELCIEFARVEHNRSVQQIADLMGMDSHNTLYKYLGSGRMPLNLLRPFEHACGCTFVSDWVGLSAGKLVIDMPRAKKATAADVNQLQGNFAAAMGLLIDFYAGNAGADDTVAAVTATLVSLAGQRANVLAAAKPELDLFKGDE